MMSMSVGLDELGIGRRAQQALADVGITGVERLAEELLAGRLMLYRVPGLWPSNVRKIRTALETLCPGQKFDGNSLRRREACDCGEPLWRMGRCVEHYRRQMRIWQRSSRKRRGQNVLVPIDSPENLSGAPGFSRQGRPKATHCKLCGADLAVAGGVRGSALCRPCWNTQMRGGRPAMSKADAGSAAARVRWGDFEARHAEIRRLRDQGLTYSGIALVMGMPPKSVVNVLRGRKK